MTSENKNIILILLILALFTGATIEMSEGSIYVGIVLFIAAAILITQIRLSGSTVMKRSKLYIIVGSFIVIADIGYNLINSTTTNLGTLDSMALFLGVSLIAYGLKKPQISRMGEFGAYISSIFIVLFLIFYSLFGSLDIDFMHKFDHYLILLPTVAITKLMGIPLEVIATETVRLSGVEEMTIVIGGPCSGLYSMFLLIGIVAGYSRIEKIDIQKTMFILGFTIAVAYVANLVRVIVLYVTAYMYGQETMMMVHTHLGWIIFAGIAGGIMYIMDRKK